MTDAVPSVYFDLGVNLSDKRFNNDLVQVLERARLAGVTGIMITGTSVNSSREAIALAEQHDDLYATAGIHPHDAQHASRDALADIDTLLAHPQVLAAGETGLDFNRDFSPRPDQEIAFAEQLALAVRHGKPVFLHERDAHPRFKAILREQRDGLCAAVVHCFTGSRKALYDYLDLDCYIGITGWICDERRGQALQSLVRDIPANRLLVETDAPYLYPRNYPHKPTVKGRNEPALLPWIVAEIARHRREDAPQLARQCYNNAQAFLQGKINAPSVPDGHPAG